MSKHSLRCLAAACLQLLAVALFSQSENSPQAWFDKGMECRNSENAYGAVADFVRAEEGFAAIGDQKGVAKAALEAGRSLMDIGNYVKAANHFERSATAAKTAFGEKSVEYGDALLELGWTYGDKWQYGQELDLVKKALDIFKRSKDKQRLARAYTHVGWSYLRDGFYREALRNLLEAKQLYDKKLSHDPYWEGRMHCFIFQVYDAYGWMKARKAHRERALEALDRIAPQHGLRWAHIAAHVSGCLKPVEADAMSQRVDSIYTALLGERSIGKAHALKMRLGYMPNNDTMKVMLERALAIYQDSLGTHSSSAINATNQMGILLGNMGQMENSIALYEKAYSMVINTIAGEANLNAIVMIENIAYATSQLGGNGCGEAFKIYEKTLALREGKYGKESLNYSLALHNLENCLQQKRDFDQLFANLAFQEKTLRKLVGDTSFFMANLKWKYGFHTSKLNDAAKAEAYFRESLELAGKILDSTDIFFANIFSSLHGIYNSSPALENPHEALKWSLKGLAFYEKNGALLPHVRRKELANLYNTLTQDYVDVAKYDSASFYLGKSVELLDEADDDYPITMLANAMQVIQNLGDRQRAELFYRKAKAVFEKKKATTGVTSFVNTYTNGYTFLYHVVATNCDSANYYLPLYVAAARQYFGQDTLGFQAQYLVSLYLKLRDCDAANPDSILAIEEQTLALKQKIQGDNCALAADYSTLATAYKDVGQNVKARFYSDKSLACQFEKANANPDNEKIFFEYLLGKGAALRFYGDPDSSLTVFDSALVLTDKLNSTKKEIAILLGWKAYVFQDKEMGDSSNFYFQKALDLIADQKESWMWSAFRKQIALNLMQRGRLLEAEKRMAEVINAQEVKATKADSADWFGVYGRILRRMGKFEEAKSYYFQSLALLNGQTEGPFEPGRLRSGNPFDLINAYSRVAYAHRCIFEKNRKKEDLQSAVQLNDYALAAADAVLENKNQWADLQSSPGAISEKLLEGGHTFFYIYEDAVELHLFQFDLTKDRRQLERAFETMERGKMREFRQLQNALQKNAKDTECENLALQLQAKRTQLQASNDRYGAGSESSAILQKELDDLYLNQKNLRCFEKEETPLATIAELQRKLLSPQQALLEYSFSDSLIIAAVVRQDTFIIYHQKPSPGLLDTLKAFRREVGHPSSDMNIFMPAAEMLYAELVAPVRQWLLPELIIVPDGELFYVPFEALLSKHTALAGSYKDLPFLVKDFSISYGLSATLLLEAKKENAVAHNRYDLDFAAFAPSYKGMMDEPEVRFWAVGGSRADKRRAGFGELEFNQPEVKYIWETYFPKSPPPYLGLAASKRQFQNYALLPRIMHLALHAKSNDRSGQASFLVFAFNPADTSEARLDIRLNVKDLMKKQNQAPFEMLVLSGCETGLGSLRRGEGIVGFNRAFSFSGAKSIVASLWAVEDEETQSLLVNFYKQLKTNRLKKHEALRAAKLELLQAGKPPYFWAPFTLFGDTGAIFPKG